MIVKGNKVILKKLIERSRQKLIPLKVYFELTYDCNLKCQHCIVSKEKDRKQLSYEEICKIIDQIAEFGCLYINFTGGEPLCRKEFFEIAAYTKKKGLAFIIQTNGTLIAPQVADKIAALAPWQVSITLLGANKYTHDKITNIKGSYEHTVRAIRLLHERKIHVYVTTVVMKQNAEELPKIEKFVQQQNASWAISAQIVPKFDGSKEPILCRTRDEQLKESIRRYSRVDIDENKRKKILNSPLCNAGGSSTTITAYGDINPCPAWMRSRERNLLGKKTFSQIWSGNKDFKRIRVLRKRDLPICRNCGLLIYCSLCPVLNFFENGDILIPARESCRRAKAKKEVLGERKY